MQEADQLKEQEEKVFEEEDDMEEFEETGKCTKFKIYENIFNII